MLNIAAYRFVPLEDTVQLRAQLLEAGRALALKGTVLLAPEGINLCLAGRPDDVECFLEGLQADPRLAGLDVKRSLSAT